MVCAGDPERSPVKEGRYLYNVDAAMAGEAAVLAAASLGMDSIWLAAIGERKVVEFLGLPKGQRVNALIALGHGRKGGLHDAVLQKVVSGRRKRLSDIAFAVQYEKIPTERVGDTTCQLDSVLTGGEIKVFQWSVE